MRKWVLMTICLLVASGKMTASDNTLSKADSLFRTGSNYKECEALLMKGISGVSDSKTKAEYCWRLSRVYLILGEQQTTKEGKREIFGKGISYAEQGIAANPACADCYMWHSANVGRDCQTRKIMEQASKVPVMTNDLETILDKLGKTEYSAAWQAYAEIYYNHPFKSNDAAINFARKAAMCIPKGELRLSTYGFLATLLYERNWSAAKRKDMAVSNGTKTRTGKFKSVVEKHEFFDGMLGADSTPVWAKSTLGAMSDKQEALAIVDYTIALYKTARTHTPTDSKDYQSILSLKNKWK